MLKKKARLVEILSLETLVLVKKRLKDAKVRRARNHFAANGRIAKMILPVAIILLLMTSSVRSQGDNFTASLICFETVLQVAES